MGFNGLLRSSNSAKPICFGSKADIEARLRDVRFTPDSVFETQETHEQARRRKA